MSKSTKISIVLLALSIFSMFLIQGCFITEAWTDSFNQAKTESVTKTVFWKTEISVKRTENAIKYMTKTPVPPKYVPTRTPTSIFHK